MKLSSQSYDLDVSTAQEWPSEWLRAVLELCVLRILAEGPTYGYEISVRLAASGLGTIKGGTLYPLLKRFEEAGRVQIEWRPGDGGPGRKYYMLTDDGQATLADLAARWHAFVQTTHHILDSAPQEEQT